jgi:hypothetical protein
VALAVLGLAGLVTILILAVGHRGAATPVQLTLDRAAQLTSGRAEVTGGSARTWSDYTTAGGAPGPPLAPGARTLITCRVRGFPVHDTNPWWYLIASPPWHKRFFVSADAFYNRPGQASGPLRRTPFVDRAVRRCP